MMNKFVLKHLFILFWLKAMGINPIVIENGVYNNSQKNKLYKIFPKFWATPDVKILPVEI